MSLEQELSAMFQQEYQNHLKVLQKLANLVTGRHTEMLQRSEVGHETWPWRADGMSMLSGRHTGTHVSPAVSLFVCGAAIQQIASKLPDGQAKRELVSATQQTIMDWEDEYCGTPPRPRHLLDLASELVNYAETLGDGALRTTILQEAGQIAQKAFGAAAISADRMGQVRSDKVEAGRSVPH
jgi:hypothetical protein